jgi:Carboxypeptidase regulatory-like domain
MSCQAAAPTRRLFAVMLAASLAFTPMLADRVAAQPVAGKGAIHGVLYQADEKTKLAGAQVAVINVKTGEHYVSNVTTDNGVYEVEGLPEGTYDIVVQAAGEIYVAENLLDLERNQRQSVSFATQPTKPANRRIKSMPPPRGMAAVVGEFPHSGAVATTGGARAFWTSPGGVVTIIALAVGAGLVIANNSGGNNASPSTP